MRRWPMHPLSSRRKKQSKRPRSLLSWLNLSHSIQSGLRKLEHRPSRNPSLDRRSKPPTRQHQAQRRPKERRHHKHRSTQNLNPPCVGLRPPRIDPVQVPEHRSPLVLRIYLSGLTSTELSPAGLLVRSPVYRADQNPIVLTDMAMCECRCDPRTSPTIDEITETPGMETILVLADSVTMTMPGRLTTPILGPTVVSIDPLIVTG
ncbi:hypothetical protein VTN02DRAFT_5332 [Thermoascus thermophilus]